MRYVAVGVVLLVGLILLLTHPIFTLLALAALAYLATRRRGRAF